VSCPSEVEIAKTRHRVSDYGSSLLESRK